MVERITDGSADYRGGYEGGYGIQDVGEGIADGYGWGPCGHGDIDYAHGTADGNIGNHDGNGFTWRQPLPATNHSARRTERIFRCPGCIGGYECSIHGRRL